MMQQAQGQRIQNPRMMPVPANMVPHSMQRQPRYTMQMMQPGQPPMQMQPGQYMQSAGQPRSQALSEALSRLPADMLHAAQQQINAEPNTERKKQIAMSFIRRGMGGYQNQGPMGPSGMMMNVGGNQQVPMGPGNMGGGQMVRMGPSPNSGMPLSGVYPSQNAPIAPATMTQMTPGQVSVQRMASQGYMPSGVPSSLQQFHSSQEQSSSASALPNYNSPQPTVIPQPSSVGPSIPQSSSLQQKGPSSVPTAVYAQPHPPDGSAQSTTGSDSGEKASSVDEPLYNQKLEQLKTYHEHVKRMNDRNRLDGQLPKPMYERLLEIMENRRKVDLTLIEKLIGRVKSMVERSSLCYPLIEAISYESTASSKPHLPDPWADFRQYRIKVPDEVLRYVQAQEEKEEAELDKEDEYSGSTARSKRPGFDYDDASSPKRFKKEEMDLISAKEEVEDEEEQEEKAARDDSRITVECMDGSQIELSREASEQLRTCSFRFDPDFIPISNECTEVQVLIENETLLVPPLRLVIPVRYPEIGASIWRDQWSFGGQSLTDVSVQFEKRLSLSSNCRSIVEIVNAWRVASEHVLRIGCST